MTVLELLSEEAGATRRSVIVASILAGIGNALLLMKTNALAASPKSVDGPTLFVFAGLVVLYIYCSRYSTNHVSELVERVVHKIKVRVGERIVRAELDALERVKAAEICDRITENTTLIVDRAMYITAMLQSAFVLFFTLAYIASVSVAACALVVLICGAGFVIFVDVRRDFVSLSQQSGMVRIAYLDGLGDLLNGFKELQFSKKRSAEIRREVVETSDSLRQLTVRASKRLTDGQLLAEGVLFALLAAITYTIHQFTTLDTRTLSMLVAGMMFTWSPFMNVAGGLMPYIRSNLALQEIEFLEGKLEDVARQTVAPRERVDPWKGSLSTIELKQLQYKHLSDDASGFHLGPIDLSLSPGEIVFIVGGNGSGKSTLLKVLTGLYPPMAGELRVGDVAVDPNNVAAYRDMISTIFTDFHIFPKLYGLEGVSTSDVTQLLRQMQLEGKTSFEKGRFSKITLSTGQKKRLAMIVTLLEKRPFCVFDEWAADQDPEFRQYFYDELLPMLRREGKLVLVVSHDDRYFHCADRVVTMDEGRIRSITTHRSVTEAA